MFRLFILLSFDLAQEIIFETSKLKSCTCKIYINSRAKDTLFLEILKVVLNYTKVLLGTHH